MALVLIVVDSLGLSFTSALFSSRPWRRLCQRLRDRRLAVSAPGFLCGALPSREASLRSRCASYAPLSVFVLLMGEDRSACCCLLLPCAALRCLVLPCAALCCLLLPSTVDPTRPASPGHSGTYCRRRLAPASSDAHRPPFPSLLTRFTENTFDDDMGPTIGMPWRGSAHGPSLDTAASPPPLPPPSLSQGSISSRRTSTSLATWYRTPRLCRQMHAAAPRRARALP